MDANNLVLQYTPVAEYYRCVFVVALSSMARCSCEVKAACGHEYVYMSGTLRESCLCAPIKKHFHTFDLETEVTRDTPHYDKGMIHFRSSDYNPFMRHRGEKVFLPYYCYVVHAILHYMSNAQLPSEVNLFTARAYAPGFEYADKCDRPLVVTQSETWGSVNVLAMPLLDHVGDFVYLHDCSNDLHVCGTYSGRSVTLHRCHLRCQPTKMRVYELDNWYSGFLHPLVSLFDSFETFVENLASIVAQLAFNIVRLLTTMAFKLLAPELAFLFGLYIQNYGVEATITGVAAYLYTRSRMTTLIVMLSTMVLTHQIKCWSDILNNFIHVQT